MVTAVSGRTSVMCLMKSRNKEKKITASADLLEHGFYTQLQWCCETMSVVKAVHYGALAVSSSLMNAWPSIRRAKCPKTAPNTLPHAQRKGSQSTVSLQRLEKTEWRLMYQLSSEEKYLYHLQSKKRFGVIIKFVW